MRGWTPPAPGGPNAPTRCQWCGSVLWDRPTLPLDVTLVLARHAEQCPEVDVDAPAEGDVY